MSMADDTAAGSSKRRKGVGTSRRKRPEFRRQESWRYVKLRASSWRRPKGIDNKMRLRFKGWPPLAGVGYRSPKDVRGIHPSGLRPVVVGSARELTSLKGREDVLVVLSRRLGGKLKRTLTDEARSLGLRVANPYTPLPTAGVEG